eukprot:snap_masked-scaffold_78-processed-gene-0.40-mRNA-1 protein AED:1.00 eAED:1.00 QI:0/0/0/0/1/1/2/0/60
MQHSTLTKYVAHNKITQIVVNQNLSHMKLGYFCFKTLTKYLISRKYTYGIKASYYDDLRS